MQLSRTAIRSVFLAAALTAVAVILAVSLDRNAYFYYWEEDRPEWTYPLMGVIVFVALALAETALVYGVFTARRPQSFGVRAVAGIVILGLWGTVLLIPVIHAPGFYMLHLLYVWLLAAAVTLALIVFLAHQGMGWLRTKVAKQK